MIKPYNRRELYIAALSDESLLLPDYPYSREETYLAKANGQSVTIPDAPYNRYETYLAKLAGENVVVPTPVSRLEMFMYVACGNYVTLPAPASREEMLWARYIDSNDNILPDAETGGIAVPKGGTITSFTLTYPFVQHGTGYASAENIRPIERYDGDIIYVSGNDISNPTEYVIDWTGHRNIAGGTVDVLTGALTETHKFYDLTNMVNWDRSGTNRYFTKSVFMIKTNDTAKCSHLEDKSGISGTNSTIGMRVNTPSGYTSSSRLLMRPWISTTATSETLEDWLQAQNAAGTPVQVAYELKTAATYELTPPDITLNDGVTRIWAKYGTISMTYTPAQGGDTMADSAKADEAILTE